MSTMFEYVGIAEFDSPGSITWRLWSKRYKRAPAGTRNWDWTLETVRGTWRHLGGVSPSESLIPLQTLVDALAFLYPPALKRLKPQAPAVCRDTVLERTELWNSWVYEGVSRWYFSDGSNQPAVANFYQDPRSHRVIAFSLQRIPPHAVHRVWFADEAELAATEKCPFSDPDTPAPAR
jgi:hypothetical protein